ncbi:MAG: hypothetical protein ISR99_00755 [Parcubacteria group bacterium]|nr:hypothetical protein [Parcubacteria group bacterium]
MRKFFGNTTKPPSIALFDIGSGSVGAAVAKFDHSGRPTIVYSTRRALPVLEELSVDRLLSHTLNAIRSVGHDVVMSGYYADGTTEPLGVLCTASSPWSAIEPITVASEGVEKEITDDLLEDLTERGRQSIIEALQGRDDGAGMNLVEEVTVRTRFDGVEPVGVQPKRAQKVDVSLLQGFISKRFHEKAEAALEEVFGATPVVIQTSMLPLFLVARDVYHGAEDFLLVDISGEVTDVVLVNGGMVSGSASFPIGKNSVVRSAASVGGVVTTDSLSNLRLRVKGRDSRVPSMQRIQQLQSAREWGTAFNEVCSNLGIIDVLPNTVVIHADSDMVDWFASQISSSRFAPLTRSKADLVSRYIAEDVPGRLCDFEGGNMGRDPGLAIIALYYQRRLLA